MFKRFYLISKHDGEHLALVEAPSKQSAMLSYAKSFYSVRVASVRDVTSSFQGKMVILTDNTEDALPVEENDKT